MKTFIDPQRLDMNLSAMDRLPGHDIVYGTPMNRPQEGLPLGDGDTGALLWLEKDAVHINLGKSDLWQDAPAGSTPDDECYNSNRETGLTCRKHAGELVIRFNSPFFDYMYQKEFCSRLSLSDATARVDAVTPFGSVKLRAFAESGSRVAAFDFTVTADEGEAPEIRLFRWGSRTLWRWYCQQPLRPECGLEGTDSLAQGNRLFITQDVGTTKFCLGLSLLGDSGIAASERLNCHTALCRLEKKREHRFTILCAVRTGESTLAAKENCEAALEQAETAGIDALYDEHRRFWADFWSRSFVSLPDDYLENIYYLYLYLMNSAGRGASPLHFIHGPWGFYHDFEPWVYYFHYNMQHLYAPLNAAGHPELAQNYYDMRRAGMTAARRYAERVKGHKGLFVHDVTDRYGRGADYDSLNTTPASQIAMQMFRHVRFTGDEAFLRDYALPMMQGAAEYYLDLLEKGEDGLWHTHGTSGYEGNYPMTDTLTDQAMIRTLFGALLPYAQTELQERLTDVLEHLPQPVLVPMEEGFDAKNGRYLYGIGKGRETVGSGKVYAIGRNENGEPIRLSTGSRRMIPEGMTCFPYIELCPLYPAGLLGLKDRGSEAFDAMMNQLSLQKSPLEGGMQWNLLTVYLARTGRGDELYRAAREALDTFQAYGNGFNAEQEEPDCQPPFQVKQWYRVTNTDTGEVFRLSPHDFSHFDFETAPVISLALTESLLQSHEGVLRLFPALPRGKSAAFSLFAEGGFRVSAQLAPEGWVAVIESLRGEPCLVEPPESDKVYAYLRRSGCEGLQPIATESVCVGRETLLRFDDLAAGDRLLLSSVPAEKLEAEQATVSRRNQDMKTCGKAHLGSPALMHGGGERPC
ncbi:MAG: hypothetical protein IJU96_07100 [Clostridia bacterium]|nr:hypothetical protein [Clostridia bacterium]